MVVWGWFSGLNPPSGPDGRDDLLTCLPIDKLPAMQTRTDRLVWRRLASWRGKCVLGVIHRLFLSTLPQEHDHSHSERAYFYHVHRQPGASHHPGNTGFILHMATVVPDYQKSSKCADDVVRLNEILAVWRHGSESNLTIQEYCYHSF
jgi:hypothetical protein